MSETRDRVNVIGDRTKGLHDSMNATEDRNRPLGDHNCVLFDCNYELGDRRVARKSRTRAIEVQLPGNECPYDGRVAGRKSVAPGFQPGDRGGVDSEPA